MMCEYNSTYVRACLVPGTAVSVVPMFIPAVVRTYLQLYRGPLGVRYSSFLLFLAVSWLFVYHLVLFTALHAPRST